jgi:hypothetical protein
MTDHTDPEHIAWLAARDQLAAAVGPDRLAEAEKRDVGGQMLIDALERAVAANDAPLWRRDPSVVMWSEKPKPGWNDNE